MSLPLGEYLVRAGAISADQRDTILERQRSSGRPFGVLAEELFGVEPARIESAWASQYADLVEEVDLSATEPDTSALDVIGRRQAWQFRFLPLWFDAEGMLVVCTTTRDLPRALRFAGWRLGKPVAFVLTTPEDLEHALERHYPIGGMRLAAKAV